VVEQLISVLRGPQLAFPFPIRFAIISSKAQARAQRALEMIGDPAVEPLIRVLEGDLNRVRKGVRS